ncbi:MULTISPECIES: DUF2254 domain-containing protein [Sphingomonas]|uniref:DUF2254 domain-containing protein n=1 Tax=Sphingomonas TaxID=13687 RepID=UPI000DBBFDF8|nr:DUF2254 domain-containing protein [Sphingomonas sp.]PZU77077.1 MAG: DUF2254 domain-containing protein [Sphingomonas sp.]HEX2019828.1 DUF2254 domain-containing protein [Aurantimonas sp.]
MRARLIRFANQLSESYWFVPTIMALAALLLAAAMIWLDSHHATGWMDSLPWLYAARPDGARSLLSSIGGSMIGVAGTTFSVTIAAVVYASGQYGPRLLSNFMSDRGNQVTLGTFIATFLYSLVVVRTIRSPGETPGEPGFVPQLAVLVGVLLVLCSIAVLIYFIHHVPSRIHINSVIERIGDRLLAEIDNRFPVCIGEPLDDDADDDRVPLAFRADATAADAAKRAGVRAKETGYVQLIDTRAIMEMAGDRGTILRLQYQAGDFVHRGSVLLEASPPEALDDDAEAKLRDAFAIGARRTALQDLRFLIDELVEIAARALSPGVNDPFTANSCLDWLGAALADLARRELPSRLRAGEDGALRVIAHPVSFAGFVDRAFGALAQYASADALAGKRFLAALGDVALGCDARGRLDVLRGQAEAFRDLADRALQGASRDAVLARADALLRALTEPDHKRRLRDGQAWLGGSA